MRSGTRLYGCIAVVQITIPVPTILFIQVMYIYLSQSHKYIQESGYYCHGWLFSFVIISSFSLIFRLVLLMYSFIFLALTLATKSFLYQPNRPTPFQQQHME